MDFFCLFFLLMIHWSICIVHISEKLCCTISTVEKMAFCLFTSSGIFFWLHILYRLANGMNFKAISKTKLFIFSSNALHSHRMRECKTFWFGNWNSIKFWLGFHLLLMLLFQFQNECVNSESYDYFVRIYIHCNHLSTSALKCIKIPIGHVGKIQTISFGNLPTTSNEHALNNEVFRM